MTVHGPSFLSIEAPSPAPRDEVGTSACQGLIKRSLGPPPRTGVDPSGSSGQYATRIEKSARASIAASEALSGRLPGDGAVGILSAARGTIYTSHPSMHTAATQTCPPTPLRQTGICQTPLGYFRTGIGLHRTWRIHEQGRQ